MANGEPARITLQQQVLADIERLLRAEHPDTLTARTNLAEMRPTDSNPVEET